MNTSRRVLHQFIACLQACQSAAPGDAQLVRRFLSRHAEAEETARAADEAFEELVQRHGPMVRRGVPTRGIDWPNVHDGVPSEGKIAERYRVGGHGVPAIFVIDRQGTLRHRWLASAEEIDQAVDALLAEGGRTPP